MGSCLKIIQSAAVSLAKVSNSPRLDAELLLAELLQCRRLDLILRAEEIVPPSVEAAFLALLARRESGEPVAYLLGYKEFFGRRFIVSPDVLVPRPETEELVVAVLAQVNKCNSSSTTNEGAPLRILEIGTGSGCISITLSLEIKCSNLKIDAVDLSSSALNIAERNAAKYGVKDRINFYAGDLFSPVQGQQYDLIVSNPPYIADNDPEVGAELSFEPPSALYSGADGLGLIKRIHQEFGQYLKSQGRLFFEFGANQGAEVTKLFGQDTIIIRDLAGRDRIAVVPKIGQ